MKDVRGVEIRVGDTVHIQWPKFAGANENYEFICRVGTRGRGIEFISQDGQIFTRSYLKKIQARIEIPVSVHQKLIDAGCEDALTFENPAFETAFVGVSHDGRAIYDYNLMVEDLVNNHNFSEEEAIDWIEYNTIRSIGYWGPKAPIVLRSIE